MRTPALSWLRLTGALGVWLITGLVSWGAGQDFRSDNSGAPSAPELYRWFSLSLTVTGLPPGSGFVPVSAPVNFSALLATLGESGAVDEHSLRLYRLVGAGEEIAEPVQFLSAPQPRSKERKLLPGTSPSVSYLGEEEAGQTPASIKVAGELAFLAASEPEGAARYRLEFGVLRAGRAIQVPYPPQNLLMFDAQGRATPRTWFPMMQIHPQWPLEGKLHVMEQDRLVTTYYVGPTLSGAIPIPTALRRPFLYPVIGPDGFSLTELGKPHDPSGSHAHHNSLWIAHASVGGKDFWSDKGGVIAHDQFELLEDGPVFCRSVQKTRWLDDAKALLLERREFTYYRAAPAFRLLDVDLQFTPAGAEAVTFGKTTFGFLAARVAQSMTVFDGGGEILNAQGDRNEPQAHLRHALWLDQSGPIAEGKWNGLAMFDHPANRNHPTGWHCRNDGWAGAAFNMDGPYTLEAGDTLRLRYRICLHRGNAIDGQVARRYAEYAAQPTVQFGPAAPRP